MSDNPEYRKTQKQKEWQEIAKGKKGVRAFSPFQISYLKLEVLIDFWLKSMSPGSANETPMSLKYHTFPLVHIPCTPLFLPLIETYSFILTENCQMTHNESGLRDVRITQISCHSSIAHSFCKKHFWLWLLLRFWKYMVSVT